MRGLYSIRRPASILRDKSSRDAAPTTDATGQEMAFNNLFFRDNRNPAVFASLL